MVKNHAIKLTVTNETNYVMTFLSDWFDSGRLADSFEWPDAIRSKESVTIMLYEKNYSIAGCSGYVQYQMGGVPVTIAFSNPSVGTNKVGVGHGTDGYQVWDEISSHDYEQFTETLWIGNTEVVTICECTEGSTNDAMVCFTATEPPPQPQLPPQLPPPFIPSGQCPPPWVPQGSTYPAIEVDVDVYP